MKTFMGNPCGFENCMSIECEKCQYYKPTFFGIKVPRLLGNILFRLEYWLEKRKTSRKCIKHFKKNKR